METNLDIEMTVVTEGLNVEDDGDCDKKDKPNEVRPDVASFGVDSVKLFGILMVEHRFAYTNAEL